MRSLGSRFKILLFLALLMAANFGFVVLPSTTIQAAGNSPQLLATNSNSLVILDTNGAVQRTVYNGLGESVTAKWSPDGSKIAFVDNKQLGVVNADGSGYKKLASGVTNQYSRFDLDWSPDSYQLVFSSGFDAGKTSIFRINADGSNNQKLFDLQSNIYVHLVGYWPDGKRLMYQEDIEYGPGAASQVFLCNLDGSNKTKLIDVTNFFVSTEVSPGKDQILFHSLVHSWVASISNPVGTARELKLSSESVAWSNVSGKIIALEGVNLNSSDTSPYRVIEFDLATGSERTITTTPPLKLFAGEATSVINLKVDSTGFAAFTNFRANSYVVDFSNGQVRSIGNAGIIGWRPNSGPTTYGNILPDFYTVWKQSDLAVASGQSKSSWLWGPDAFATRTEDYKEAPGGKRQVQYFDKVRMEITNPNGDHSNLYFVTNGLLPKELISGQMQVGDNSFIKKSPAEVNVAGDAGGSVTYAKLVGVTTLEIGKNTAPNRVGQPVTAAIDRNGNVSQQNVLPGVQLATYLSQTQHNIPNVFWDYFKTLPQDWLFVMGYPLSEPYITEITLAGKPTLAMVQVFERRVLTYTPSNPDPYKVEQGNVGRHYFQWRYGN